MSVYGLGRVVLREEGGRKGERKGEREKLREIEWERESICQTNSGMNIPMFIFNCMHEEDYLIIDTQNFGNVKPLFT